MKRCRGTRLDRDGGRSGRGQREIIEKQRNLKALGNGDGTLCAATRSGVGAGSLNLDIGSIFDAIAAFGRRNLNTPVREGEGVDTISLRMGGTQQQGQRTQPKHGKRSQDVLRLHGSPSPRVSEMELL